jgi:hypothetical protein
VRESTIKVTLHGLFSFRENSSGLKVHLPKVMHHKRSILIDDAPFAAKDGSVYTLGGVLGGGKRLLDDEGTHMILTFKNQGEESTAEGFFTLELPLPAEIKVLSSAAMLNNIVVYQGHVLNGGMKEFADKFELTYAVDGGANLNGQPIERSMYVKSGPEEEHGSEHRRTSFQASLSFMSGVDAFWDGELALDHVRERRGPRHPGHGRPTVEPPGCSASGGSTGDP